MKPRAKSEQTERNWGGARKGSGRKSQWPVGTKLKTMRLPESLEEEVKQFALDRLNQPLENISKPRIPRKRKPKRKEITLENAAYWMTIHTDTDEVLPSTLARDPVDTITKSIEHFGKEWADITSEGWDLYPVALELPDWR